MNDVLRAAVAGAVGAIGGEWAFARFAPDDLKRNPEEMGYKLARAGAIGGASAGTFYLLKKL